MKLSITAQVTLDGLTYLPGQYSVIEHTDPASDEVTRATAKKLLANHPLVVSEIKGKKKPKPQPTSTKAKSRAGTKSATPRL